MEAGLDVYQVWEIYLSGGYCLFDLTLMSLQKHKNLRSLRGVYSLFNIFIDNLKISTFNL